MSAWFGGIDGSAHGRSSCSSHTPYSSVGYAAAASGGVLPMAWRLVAQYPNVLAATVALDCCFSPGSPPGESHDAACGVRPGGRIHLYLYLAMALALAHQISAGAAFVASAPARFGGSVCGSPRPVWCSSSASGCPSGGRYAMGCGGRGARRRCGHDLHRHEGSAVGQLPVRGGQYLNSAIPPTRSPMACAPLLVVGHASERPPPSRITVKNLGDHSSDLTWLKPGTWVAIEGAYGQRPARCSARSACCCWQVEWV